MGIMTTTTGVLFKKADTIAMGTMRRNCAPASVVGLPNSLPMYQSRAPVTEMPSATIKRAYIEEKQKGKQGGETMHLSYHCSCSALMRSYHDGKDSFIGKTFESFVNGDYSSRHSEGQRHKHDSI